MNVCKILTKIGLLEIAIMAYKLPIYNNDMPVDFTNALLYNGFDFTHSLSTLKPL